MDRLRLSSKLVRIARMLIIANIAGDFRTAMLKADPSLDENALDGMCDFVKSCSSKPKIQRLASYCLVRGFLEWPGGKQDFDTVVRLFGLVNDLNQGRIRNEKDYDKLAHPGNYPNDPDCKRYVSLLYGQDARQERITGGFNPNVEFKGGKDRIGDVVIYRLKDEPEEMQRVRRALDVAYGMDANPWCLAARIDRNDPSFEPGSDNFKKSWKHWRDSRKGPRKIAFFKGRPVAFYAERQWWDLDDEPHDDLPVMTFSDDADAMREMLDGDDDEPKMQLARNRSLSDDVIGLMVSSSDPEVRKAVAGSPRLPRHFIDILMDDRNHLVRKSLAGRDSLPLDVMKKLARDPEEEVCQAVAERKDLPEDLAMEMAGSYSSLIRGSLADNHGNLSDDVIRLILEESEDDEDVLESLSWRNDLPADVIDELASYEDDDEVRISVADKSGLSPDLVKMLSGDGSCKVRKTIAKRDGLPAEVIDGLCGDEKEEVREALAGNSHVPLKMIRILMRDDGKNVRKAMAGRGDLSPADVTALFSDSSPEVREALAKRDSLPRELVESLAEDADSSVRAEVARRSDLTRGLLEDLAHDLNEDVRAEVAAREDLPLGLLEELAHDPREHVRCYVALRDSIPAGIARKLEHDPSEFVRKRFLEFHGDE